MSLLCQILFKPALAFWLLPSLALIAFEHSASLVYLPVLPMNGLNNWTLRVFCLHGLRYKLFKLCRITFRGASRFRRIYFVHLRRLGLYNYCFPSAAANTVVAFCSWITVVRSFHCFADGVRPNDPVFSSHKIHVLDMQVGL